MVGIFSGHATYHTRYVPANIIQAGYKVENNKNGIQCLVALKKVYKEHDSFFYTSNTCENVQKQLRKFYESH